MTVGTKQDPKQNLSVFRPYSRGMVEHDNELASIVLVKKKLRFSETVKAPKASVSGAPSTTKDTDFFSPIQPANIDTINRLLNSVSSGERTASSSVNEVAFLDLSESKDNLGYYGVFNNFSLTQFSEEREEVVKVTLNFGGTWNAFFFGERPRIYSFGGIFLDSKDYPYYQEFMIAYERYLSGRKCIESGMQLTLSYNGKLLKGHLLRISTSGSADSHLHKTFNFTVLVESDSWYRNNIIDGEDSMNGLSNRKRYEQSFVSKEQTSNSVDNQQFAGDSLSGDFPTFS